MRKAPTINSLALGSIRARKRQYATLVTGIMLAIIFTSSMLLIGQSIYHTYQERRFRQVGKQDAVLLNAQDVSPQELVESGYVQSVGSAYIIGETEESEMAIAYYDEAGEALTYKQCIQGRMPKAVGEIAVERSKLLQMRSDAQVGDTLTLSIKVPDGNGFLPDAVKKIYMLVGILSDQTTYQMEYQRFSPVDYLRYPGAVVYKDEQVEAGGRPVIHRFVKFAPLVAIKAFDEYGENILHSHWIDYFQFDFIYEEAEGNQLFIFVGILGMALILAACMGIVGAFAMMLSDRRAQIGMLRAVGATRRQIRRIFGREALVIAVIVSPVAILLSHFTVWLLCKVLQGGLLFYSAAWFLPLELLLSIAIVMSAAFIPLRQASRVSPMQAIRETSLLRAKKRMRIRAKFSYWPPNLLAWRYMRLYRAKQVGISVVTALGLVILTLGVDMAAWSIRYTGPRSYDFTIQCDSWLSYDFVEKNALRPLLTDGDLMEAATLPGVEKIRASKTVQINMMMEKISEYLTGRELFYSFGYLQDDTQLVGDALVLQQLERKQYLALKNWLGIDMDLLTKPLTAISPDMLVLLKPYVLSGEINMEALSEGREILVVAPDKVYMQFQVHDSGNSYSSSSTSTPDENEHYDKVLENDMFHAGDTLTLCRLYTEGGYTGQLYENGYDFDTIHRVDRTVRIGAVLSDLMPWEIGSLISSGEDGVPITTFAGLNAMGFETSGYTELTVTMMSGADEETLKYAETALSDISKRSSEVSFYSSYESMLESDRWEMMVTVMLFAISILFFSICVSMVNNAVTGRIRSDKRAIGTLRAVGAPLRVIAATYLRQAGIMLGWGIAGGILLSTGILVYQAYLKNFMPSIILPLLGLTVLYILLILLFCGINLRARIRGIVRSSIIDNIREL